MISRKHFFRKAAPQSKNSWNNFQIQITPLFWCPQGPKGCLEKQNCPLSWNLAVLCAKIELKTQKLQKTIKKPSFFVVFLVISEVFWSFWVLGPILAHQTAKFQLSGQFCFSKHSWGPWGRQSSGMKPESADLVTDICEIHCYWSAHIFWVYYFILSQCGKRKRMFKLCWPHILSMAQEWKNVWSI